MQKIKYSGARDTISEFIHVGSRINPIFLTMDINASALTKHCSEQGLSCTPVLIKVVAETAAKHPIINSVLARGVTLGKKIYQFENIDVAVSIEKKFNGETFVTTPIIRGVNRKTTKEVGEEVQKLARQPFRERPDVKPLLLFNRLPSFLKYIVLRILCQSHVLFRQFFGTVGFTNLGSLGVGYLYPHWLNTVVFGFGTIEKKPVVCNDEITIAPVLPVSMAFSHRVVDGCEAARILADFRKTIEAGEFGD